MGLLDRLRSWIGFGGGARAALPAASSVSQAELGLALARITGGYRFPRRGSEEMLRAYGELPWLHTVVRRRAQAVARLELQLYRSKDSAGARSLVRERTAQAAPTHEALARHEATAELVKEGKLERVHEHPFLTLFWRPNGAMTGRSLWQLSSEHQDLLAETLWGLSRPKKGARPTAIWPLVPTWLSRSPTPDDPYWHLNLPGETGARRAERDVLWIRQHDPLDPYNNRGVSTAAALGHELDIDAAAAKMAKARFHNRAAPEVILGFPSKPLPEAMKRLEAELRDKHQGPERAGQFHLFNDAVTAQVIGHTLVQSQYVQLRQLARDFCMQTFGAPPEVFGVLDNANRSTIDAAAVHFAIYSTVPALDLFVDELDAWLLPEWGEDLWLHYASPVPVDKERRKGLMVALPSAFYVDDIRIEAGLAPLPDGAGKVLMTAPGAVPVEGDAPQDVKPAKKKPAPADDKDEADEED